MNTKRFFFGWLLFVSSSHLLAEISPAPGYCADNFGTYETRTSPLGEYGVCIWDEYVDSISGGCYSLHSECADWDFYNGLCKKGDCQQVGYEIDANDEWNWVCIPQSPR